MSSTNDQIPTSDEPQETSQTTNLLSDEVSALKIEREVPSDFEDLVESKDNGSAPNLKMKATCRMTRIPS